MKRWLCDYHKQAPRQSIARRPRAAPEEAEQGSPALRHQKAGERLHLAWPGSPRASYGFFVRILYIATPSSPSIRIHALHDQRSHV